jgi:hypothetical protein
MSPSQVSIRLVHVLALLMLLLIAINQAFARATLGEKLRFAIVTQRWHEELQAIAQELIEKGHSVQVLNSTANVDDSSIDLALLDRRYLLQHEMPTALTKIVIVDNDMLLDCDFPILSVPAPFSQYGKSENEFKESTFSRMRNALDRLSFHISSAGRSRRMKKQLVTISTSSFIIEASRPIPPWLQMVGLIQRWRRLKRVKMTARGESRERLLLHLGSRVSPASMTAALRFVHDEGGTNLDFMVATSAPYSEVDPDGHLRNTILPKAIWLENVDLSSFENHKLVLTSSDVRSVLTVLSVGAVPVVITETDDVYSHEMANALKRRGLGVGIIEEGLPLNATALLSRLGAQVRTAKDALSSPVETSGLRRALEIIEAIAEDVEGITSRLVPDVPPWYQYWFLDVYTVYGLVMVSVFVLTGSLATAASTLFV